MPKFLILGHGGKPPSTPEEAKAGMAAWGQWFSKSGAAIVDMGSPFQGRDHIGDISSPTAAQGFMIVQAADLAGAKDLVASSPAATEGTGLEILELADMSGKFES